MKILVTHKDQINEETETVPARSKKMFKFGQKSVKESCGKKKLKEDFDISTWTDDGYAIDKNELVKALQYAAEDFINGNNDCYTFPIDDRLAVCVGLSDGYQDEGQWIDAEDGFGTVYAGIKCYTSDDMRTNYNWINYPHSDEEAYVYEQPLPKQLDDKAYGLIADYLIDSYNELKQFDFSEDGKVEEIGPDYEPDWYDDDDIEESCHGRRCENRKPLVRKPANNDDIGDDEIYEF